MPLFRNAVLAAAMAVALAPAAANAADGCEQAKHDNKVMGTLFGAAAGAVLGGAIAAHGHKSDGALVGAAGGAVVGNQISRSKAPCGDPAPQPVAYYAEPMPPPMSTISWRDRYGRACTRREETYYEEDGSAVQRTVERCEP